MIEPDSTADASVDAIASNLHCPQCGYLLRGLIERRCPECGGTFDPALLSETLLPWAHRRRLGRFRAYAQTFHLAILHPHKLAAEMKFPQSYRDAQRFRWTTVALAWLSIWIATIINWESKSEFLWQPPDGGTMGLGFSAIFLVGGLAAYATITGLPSYFFHPRSLPIEQQNRAIALSYYACAPIAAAPCLLVIGWGIHVLFGQTAGYWASQSLLVLPCVFWWWSLLVLTRCGLKLGRPVRTVVVAVVVPILWVVIGNAAEIMALQMLKFAAMVYYSLQV